MEYYLYRNKAAFAAVRFINKDGAHALMDILHNAVGHGEGESEWFMEDENGVEVKP